MKLMPFGSQGFTKRLLSYLSWYESGMEQWCCEMDGIFKRKSPRVEWNEDTVKDLEIEFAPVSDNTSEFTRTELRSKIPQRYFHVKLTFRWNGEESQYLRVDDGVVPYVHPPPPQKGGRTGSQNLSRYGSQYVYASLSRVLDHIVNEDAARGYSVFPGEHRMPSIED
ncbi:hypothetical protein N7532_001579 [Penicillium argentinense]|uniref:Uncharacterized protein n=1 Tax=Penicillium argentinense TaxID=1131581 RepID=A0A9W9KLD5_9EURO|nr:uncharacterized protein N7532_001579 [Penicillium argentinense]KAJ5111044.1 hypothetical protein N7532_001579 [Penicillium argentinense]